MSQYGRLHLGQTFGCRSFSVKAGKVGLCPYTAVAAHKGVVCPRNRVCPAPSRGSWADPPELTDRVLISSRAGLQELYAADRIRDELADGAAVRFRIPI